MSTRTILCACIALALASAVSCRRQPVIADEVYVEAVARFHTGLAALQTSQDVLARRELERVTQIVPQEPAAWADLGLLFLRQQQLDEASARLAKASELAPESAAIERLRALTESQKGNVEQAIRHWRRAAELDAADVKAPFALAQEIERQGGAANEAEAQRVLESLAARSGNLAVQIEYARLAARRGDQAALAKALDALSKGAASWPADAQARLQAVRDAAARAATEAATPVIFLKNVLLRTPEYRAAFAAVTTPRSEVGEPLTRFLVLKNPDPHPAPPDEHLTFALAEQPIVALPDATWAGAVWLTGEGAPAIVVANARDARLSTGATVTFPSQAGARPLSIAGIAAADLNYDFRTDFVVAGSTGLRIFRQGEKGAFADVTAAASLPADVTGGALFGAWPADVDTDGDLDLVVARDEGPAVVLRNNTDDTFTVQSPFDGVSRVRDFVWADLDGEGVPDAALLDAQGTLHTFLNRRNGVFAWRAVPAAFRNVVAIAAIEVTGDSVMDLVGASAAGAIVTLSNAADGASWNAAQAANVDGLQGLSPGAARVIATDLDNNGAADLIVSAPSSARVLLRKADGGWHPLSAALPFAVSAAADLGGNGRLDLIAPGDGGARVAHNRGQLAYHWQSLRPRAATATGDQRINSFGIGGEVEVRTGLHAQKQIITSPVVHFGLGAATRAEVARIVWPNGVLQSEFDLAADVTIPASQRLKGSCPWLFAWNGREMSFVTDFIWRSPLGLRINAQATADVLMTEDRVRIRGDQLAPKDGFYDLRITAELWETHFFDLVSLLVVDHPAGTEVFVDERFAVPAPSLTAVATGPVQPFAAARDDGQRDVMDVVALRDDRHLDFAGRGRYQGVTREHYVELELPDEAPRTGPLWLIGQAWVHPTDSSVNVALAQGAHATPAGLSIHVADAAGSFREARSRLGFPAGKDKTVLLDLSGLFRATGSRRLRLQTNMEIYWDRLGWAPGRPDVTLTPRRIDPASADLRYRGYSPTEQKDTSTPERPRYEVEGTAPRWRDLEGFHTRFGDVIELLRKVDDRYVIMNAGDELQLRFPEAPPSSPGMIRDFVLVGDGWEKDGDFNTTASRTVLPLPTHGSGRYEPGSGRLEDDPIYQQHRDDFERYHTRYVSGDRARDALER
ncbi:MAG: FG-GAP-like repeat-containing protein [Vicinamibacterales bacterium]